MPLILVAGQIDLSNITVKKPELSKPVVKLAWDELSSTLKKITGQSPTDGQYQITLSIDLDLPPDGFKISTENGNLRIFGGSNYGVLYGVYSFLEDDLGCRWYQPEITVISQLKQLKITVKDRSEAPAFTEVRDPFSYLESNTEWALHNRVIRMMNNTLPQELGEKITFPRIDKEFWLCHTTHYFCPDSMFAVHPEYFMVNTNGKRSKQQICPCNPEVRKLAAQKIISTLDKAPDANYITLSMEDNVSYCHCPQCTAINQREGSNGAAFFELANEVATEVAKKHPNVKVIVLAYYATSVPPKNMQIADNITILYADINRPRSALAEVAKNKNCLEKWNRIAKEIIIWDYQVDFTDYYRYVLSLRAVAKNLAFYRSLSNIKGVAIQGAYQGMGGARQGLRAWVEAKLLWNPERDYQQLMRDYVHGVYGPAAPPIEKFYIYLDNLELQQVSAEAKYAEIIAFGKQCFNAAKKLAKDNPTILKQVEAAELPILFYELDQLYALRYRKSMTQEKRKQALKLIDTIAITMKANKFFHRSEGIHTTGLKKYSDAMAESSPNIPGVTAGNSIIIPAIDGMYCLGAKKVMDDKAAYKTAVRQPPGNSWSWQISFMNKNIPAGKYRIRIRNRIEKTGGAITKILYGVYDSATKSTTNLFIDPKTLDHPDYRWHELKTSNITPSSSIWVMIQPKNNNFIHYIDCIELVPEK